MLVAVKRGTSAYKMILLQVSRKIEVQDFVDIIQIGYCAINMPPFLD